MPTVSRTRSVRAAPEEIWAVVSDPERLPDWWPGVKRVEDASREAWTMVLSSPRGKTVRADYTLVEADAPARLVWRHEVEESPFERILRDSLTELEIEPGTAGLSELTITVRHRPRGFARLGFVQLRQAAVRQLEGALDALEELLPKAGG
jgi:uncharacterized protein YndB with AHSA1/START domain